jgi:hypothetical protein
MQKYKVQFAFRNFSLNDIPLHVQHAVKAAEAALFQDESWKMYDYLFEHQNAFNDNHLLILRLHQADICYFRNSRHLFEK